MVAVVVVVVVVVASRSWSWLWVVTVAMWWSRLVTAVVVMVVARCGDDREVAVVRATIGSGAEASRKYRYSRMSQLTPKTDRMSKENKMGTFLSDR